MIQFFFRCSVILATVITQVSFFPAIFPNQITPMIVLVVAIAWIVVGSFEDLWIWVVVLGIMYDFLSFHQLGTNMVMLVLGTYGISFISRRFFLDHQGIGNAISIGYLLNYSCIVAVILGWSGQDYSRDFWKLIPVTSFWTTILTVAGYNILLYFPIFFGLRKMERFLSYYNHRAVLK